MALDVAEYLWNKYENSLREAESELTGTISLFKSIKKLLSHFKAIKDVVNERDIMPERYTYSETIDVLYELNDALADWRIFAHECKELNNKLSNLNLRRHSFIRNMKIRLDTIKKKLEELVAPEQESRNSLGMTRPALKAEVFGFDKLSQEIVEMLQHEGGSSNSGKRAIGVIGIAGVGKTSLVHKVLETKEVKYRFDPILWLPFSGMREAEQQYSRFSFETCIFDYLGITPDESIVGLDKLLERLDKLLSGKRYLLVLDDVYHQHINIVGRLWSGLHKDGVVIVTSRSKEVTRNLVEQKDLIHLKPLDRETCWRIFKETIKNPEILASSSHEKIEEIKNQCHGLPLVAKKLAEIIAGT